MIKWGFIGFMFLVVMLKATVITFVCFLWDFTITGEFYKEELKDLKNAFN